MQHIAALLVALVAVVGELAKGQAVLAEAIAQSFAAHHLGSGAGRLSVFAMQQ